MKCLFLFYFFEENLHPIFFPFRLNWIREENIMSYLNKKIERERERENMKKKHMWIWERKASPFILSFYRHSMLAFAFAFATMFVTFWENISIYFKCSMKTPLTKFCLLSFPILLLPLCFSLLQIFPRFILSFPFSFSSSSHFYKAK